MLETTFPRYIRKPNIVGTTTTQIRVIEGDYRARFDKILVREGGSIDFRLYSTDKDFIIHLKVPSETIENFYYDVAIKFKGDTNVKFAPTLSNYNIQVFTNDPAFAFTYAYAFNKEGLFFRDLSDKMGKEFLETPAKDRNPRNMIGYVKSLYFAYFFMESKGLFEKRWWEKAIPYKKDSFARNIMSTQTKIDKRIKLGAEIKRKEKEESQKQQKPKNRFNMTGTDHVKPVKVASQVSRTNLVKQSKKVSSVKVTKKVQRKK